MAGGAPRSEAVRRAHQVIENAWTAGRPYDLASQAAFALESAQLLQSPETAAEVERQVRELVAVAIEQRGAAFLPSHPVHPYVAVFASIARGAEVAPRAAASPDPAALSSEREQEIRAEALGEFVAWLAKKAREHRAQGPQYAKQADVIGKLASKVARGAVRPNNLASLPPGPEPAPEDVPALHRDLMWTRAERDGLLARVAELEHAAGTVYRAQHDSIPMGLYTNLAAAQAHCEAKVRQEEPAGSIETLDWWADPEEDEPAYELSIVPVDTSSGMRSTGCSVTPLLVDSEFYEGGDE